MEENKRSDEEIAAAEGSVQNNSVENDKSSVVADVSTVEDTANTVRAEVNENDAVVPETETVEESPSAAPPVAPRWNFGAPAYESFGSSRRRTGTSFLITFFAVFMVCIVLLVATFAIGEGGFKIVRTLMTERIVYVREYNSESGLLTPNEAADVIRKSTVTVLVRGEDGTGHGSGFLYNGDGYICTNYHVIAGAVSVQVLLPDGQTVDAEIKGGDVAADVAVLKIDPVEGLVPAKLGESAALLSGDDVVAVGTPGKIEYAGTATFGKVSYPLRLVPMDDESGSVEKKMNLIQTDTSVNPGNSGGPLGDMYGRVVGVVVMKVSVINGKPFDGIGFALPIDGVKIIVDAIIENGSFTGENPIAESRSLLGVSGRGLKGGMWYDDPMAEVIKESETEKEGYFKMPFDGIYVMGVNLPNAQSLQEGDIITAIDGMRMYTIYDVIKQINRYRVGDAVTVTYHRRGLNGYTEHTVEIFLAAE